MSRSIAAIAAALLAGACAAAGPLPARVDFEAGPAGGPPSARGGGETVARYRLDADPVEGLIVSEVAPLDGARSLCIGGADAPRRLAIAVPDPRGLANDRPLRLEFAWRMVGFGRVGLEWRVSGQVLRTWRMIVARAINPDAEPEPVGGFFAPEQDQPLFLFENGGRYRAVVTVDPVERAPYAGLRQSRLVVTDIGAPGEEAVLYDSYGFFTPAAALPDAYAGQSLAVVAEQADPGGWPCLDSALTLDAITFLREE